MFFEILSVCSSAVLVFLCLGIRKWCEAYFSKKAENFATKRDIGEITSLTEKIYAKYREQQSMFDANLQFKYRLCEEQYRKLYVPLYWKVCNSEATRSAFREFGCVCILFEEAPIMEYGDVGLAMRDIVELIEKNKELASPELIRISTSLLVIEKETSQRNSSDLIAASHIQSNLIKALVKAIIKDYNNLRKTLRLDENGVDYTVFDMTQFMPW